MGEDIFHWSYATKSSNLKWAVWAKDQLWFSAWECQTSVDILGTDPSSWDNLYSCCQTTNTKTRSQELHLRSCSHALCCLCPWLKWILLPSFLCSRITFIGRRNHKNVKAPFWEGNRKCNAENMQPETLIKSGHLSSQEVVWTMMTCKMSQKA